MRVGLKDKWDRLGSEAKTWLLEHPACLVLPPAISAEFCTDPLEDLEFDQQGRVVLCREDRDFIRDKAEAAGTIRVPTEEYLFFDTAPVPVVRVPGEASRFRS